MRRCVMGKIWFTVFNVKVTTRAYIIKIQLFLLYLLNFWSICNQTWLDSTASEARVSWGKNCISGFKVKVTVMVQDISKCLSVWYLLNCRSFWYPTWYGNAASWIRVPCRKNNCLLSSRSRAQQGLMWSKYDSFYYIFWTVDSLATKLGLVLHDHKPKCFVKKERKKDHCIQGQGHSEGSKCQCLSRWYLLHCPTFCYQTWYWDASPRAGMRAKDWFAIFKVKVAATAHMIKIWLFLLYFLNCWFLGNQTWSDDTSECPMKKIGLLHSRSRSQRRVKI